MSVRFINGVSLRNRLRAATNSAAFPLDGFSTADLEAVYSLRQTRAAYGGGSTDYIVRLRRSTGGTEADVKIDPATQRVSLNSPIDLSGVPSGTLGTWVGANSAFVSRWYDQSGNARTATQVTGGLQARLINAGVLDKTVSAGATPGFTPTAAQQGVQLPFITPTTTLPEYVVFAYSSVATQQNVLDNIAGIQEWLTFGGDRPYLQVFDTARPAWPASMPANFLLSTRMCQYARRVSATGMELEVFNTVSNSTGVISQAGTAFSGLTYYLGGTYSSTEWKGAISEVFIFSRNLTSGERTALRTNQFGYWI
jgi:hypothetical protein